MILSSAASLLLAPFLDFTWWKVFRRCASISAAVTLWAVMRYRHRQPLRTLGLGPWRDGWRMVLLGLAVSLATACLLQGFYLAVGFSTVSLHADHAKIWKTMAGFVPAAVLVAVLEELIFRGYVLQRLMTHSRRAAIWGSSISFALIHFRQDPFPQIGLELVGMTILGWILAQSVLKTGQLYLAIGLHAGFAYWARNSKLWIQMALPQAAWLPGNPRLIDGVGAWIALAVIGWWIYARVGRTTRSPS